jgi:hypothetical protein
MEEIDPLLVARTGQSRRALAARAGAVRDSKAWSDLIADPDGTKAAPKPVEKPEPPKPRAVVDVYRGDKHVQELFQ